MGLLVAAVALFGAGVAGSLSPCVLPLVPGYLGILADGASARSSQLARMAAFCTSAVATFVALGSAVAALGSSLTLASMVAQRTAGAALVVMGVLAALAAAGRRVPGGRLLTALPQRPGWRAIALGVGCGAAWSPCVGPLLGAALTAAGGSGSALRGAVLLAAFGAGVVSPFVGLALLPFPTAPSPVRRLGRAVARVTPVLLIVLGTALLAGAYEGIVQRLAIGT
jgi:cytochrome c-type biogenesis protein